MLSVVITDQYHAIGCGFLLLAADPCILEFRYAEGRNLDAVFTQLRKSPGWQQQILPLVKAVMQQVCQVSATSLTAPLHGCSTPLVCRLCLCCHCIAL